MHGPFAPPELRPDFREATLVMAESRGLPEMYQRSMQYNELLAAQRKGLVNDDNYAVNKENLLRGITEVIASEDWRKRRHYDR